jgi:hypothetical protein
MAGRYAALPWETDYAHDRRNHRHRCRCCSRIINAGERVLMAKVANRTTWALHIACADRPNGPDPKFTWRDSFNAWAKPVPTFTCSAA